VSRQLAVVVNAASSSSLLCFGYAVCLLCFFCSLLSTVFLPLYSGFVEVLLVLAVPLVAAKRRTGHGTWRMLLRFFFPVFSSSSSCILLCFVYSPPSLSLSYFLSFPCSPLFLCSRFPFFFSFLSLCVFPLLPRFLSALAPLPVQSSSPAFIGQREPCAGNGRLVICM